MNQCLWETLLGIKHRGDALSPILSEHGSCKLSLTGFVNNFAQSKNIQPLCQMTILGSPKQEQFPDDNFKFDGNGGDFFKRVKNSVEKEKLLMTSNFSFSPMFSKDL